MLLNKIWYVIGTVKILRVTRAEGNVEKDRSSRGVNIVLTVSLQAK